MSYRREQTILLARIGDRPLAALRQHDALISGGAVTSVFSGIKSKDFDVYFRTAASRDLCLAEFAGMGQQTYKTDLSTTFTVGDQPRPFQLITSGEFLREPAALFELYDFTICMGAYDVAAESFILHEDFLKHLAQRRLVFHIGTLFPICSLVRMKKYVARGFAISGTELLKMGLAVERLRIRTYADLRRHLMGIDTFFLKDLVDQFKDAPVAERQFHLDEFMITLSDYIDHVPHLSTEEE